MWMLIKSGFFIFYFHDAQFKSIKSSLVFPLVAGPNQVGLSYMKNHTAAALWVTILVRMVIFAFSFHWQTYEHDDVIFVGVVPSCLDDL